MMRVMSFGSDIISVYLLLNALERKQLLLMLKRGDCVSIFINVTYLSISVS